MNISKPIGDSTYGPCVIRVVIGLYLSMVGLSAHSNMPGFLQGVRTMFGYSESTSIPLASNFPYICMAVGFLLIIGLWTTMTASLASIISAYLIYNTGLTVQNVAANKDIMILAAQVGQSSLKSMILNRDVLVLAGCVSLLYTGAGFFSIDSFRKG